VNHAAAATLTRLLAATMLAVAGSGPLLPLGAATASARPVPSADVVGDDEADRYVGTGAIVIPANGWQGSADGRSQAAGCEGCRWRITEVCSKSEFATGGCRDISLGCPIGTDRLRVWLAAPGEDWSLLGTTCLGEGPPTSREDLGTRVADQAVQHLPGLDPGFDPPGGTLVGLAAVFRAGQPPGGLRDLGLEVVGLDVSLDARARWHWAFGDDVTTWSERPGGAWPDDTVAHSYRSAGTYSVEVRAVWRASYTVEGLGPFTVPGTLEQVARLRVPVQEARAVLVG
jgi:hypothetical protein